MGWEHYRQFNPNQTHYDLAALNPASLITQNVDGLHRAAGSDPVLELHGSLYQVVCLNCGRVWSRDWMQEQLAGFNPGFMTSATVAGGDVEINPDGDVELNEVTGFRIPDCPVCHGILKPDVVYFGEQVRPQVAAAAAQAVEDAESVLVLGSSLAVHSALRLVRMASREQKPIVVVTDGPTRADDLATVRVVGRVAPFVAGWRAELMGG
ncbi:MAG: Sir2 family NAD-dependent protein deacetylase [Ancrocorticia populi]|uniref:Sir2 family NAD-dependent protein deacetylase n=1 Tax=Ancrocorticia populi TaxID=2175228 RepID=UPI003F93BAD6